MQQTLIMRVIRATGILVSVFIIPVALEAILNLQNIGSVPEQWVETVLFVSSLMNLIVIPFILVGFITKYRIPQILFLALLRIAVSLAEAVILLAQLRGGDLGILLLLTLPAVLYGIGWLLREQ